MAQTISVCVDDGHELNHTASTIPIREPFETASTIPTREPSETASTISTREPSENLKSVKTSITPRSKTEDIKSSDITGQSATIQNTVKLILGNTNRQTYTPNTTKHTSNKDTQDGKSKIIGSTVGTIAALSGLVAIASFLLRKCKKNSVNPDTGDQSDTASISSDQPFFIPTEFSQEIASGTPAIKHSYA